MRRKHVTCNVHVLCQGARFVKCCGRAETEGGFNITVFRSGEDESVCLRLLESYPLIFTAVC